MLFSSRPSLGKQTNRKEMKESQIFNIKLPPEPYKFLEGVGFVSENKGYKGPMLGRHNFQSFLQKLKGNAKTRPNILRIPTSFLSNGKPSGLSTITPGSVRNTIKTTAQSETESDKPDEATEYPFLNKYSTNSLHQEDA